MDSIRAIRGRIHSIESTRQITKSMRMVAAAKLRKVQMQSSRFKPFAETARRLLSQVLSEGKSYAIPLLEPASPSGKVCYVLFVGNRGLCGGYHTGLLKYLADILAQEQREAFLVIVGRWGTEQIAALGCPVVRVFSEVTDTPAPEEAKALGEYLRALYCGGEAEEVILVYQQYFTALRQEPGAVTLLPMEKKGGEKGSEVIFEPDRESVLRSLAELSYTASLYSVFLESKTSEHTARMTAMTAATDNTDELIEELIRELNHARQSAITTELSEIVGGAAALNGNDLPLNEDRHRGG